MHNEQPLASILDACERLRRLPSARWSQPPRPPLGSVPPNAVAAAGVSLEDRLAAYVGELMTDDAGVRGVSVFVPDVSVLSLPDLVAALAKSVAERNDAEGNALLARIAGEMREL